MSGFDPNSAAARRFFGAWRYVGSTIDGKPHPVRGANPKGIIIYDPSGYMAAQVFPDGRTKAGQEPTPDEAKKALTGLVGYFGRYTIDERAGTVTHHREATVQPGEGGAVVRGYEFVGDRLILRPAGRVHEVIWERIK